MKYSTIFSTGAYFLISFSLISSFLPNKLLAETQIKNQLELTNETPAFQGKRLTEGDLSIEIDFQPYNFENNDDNLKYRLFYQGKEKFKASKETFFSQVYFQPSEKDNPYPYIVIQTYSGGAHCCTSFYIYTWLDGKFVETSIENLNSGGGIFKDLKEDNSLQFVTNDNSFLYAFSSYAGSYPPSLIYDVKKGELIENTRNYPNYLQETADDMLTALKEGIANDYEVNGVLAGYVAQKILLDEYEEGWQFMLENFDRNDTTGLTIYNAEFEEVGQHPDFPTALKAFLQERGYLKLTNEQ
ncbi:hypothetical protein [Cyanobacterium sp. Dongsha4]|uniref:hypothetical protein n=1 Tax=Cyanobacterium sp. DS4 TaxID=2878255 RepID=UPI002E8007E6|nr:hypothetical protein [Cyanobacterium sp. Dongsha4]WVL00634.1 hypothetical protein Dongsha4_00060 [Cyanobacterium sp. Dongsha4]